MSELPQKPTYSTSYSLLERVRDPHDKEAWSQFVVIYEQYVYNILRHIGIPESDAMELRQDIIIKLWEKIPEFAYDKDRGKFRHWLGAVIRNDANKYFNRKNAQNKMFDAKKSENLEQYSEHDSNYDLDAVIAEEWNHHISNLAWKSIQSRFKENMQQVFLLYAEGKSYKEIAKLCNIDSKSTKMYVKRIRDHLRAEINIYDSELL
jgi:RNA polymerase sigma factor (sigma-70 family)